MKIEEVVHYLLRVDQEELRVLGDALDFYIETCDDIGSTDTDISQKMLSIVQEML